MFDSMENFTTFVEKNYMINVIVIVEDDSTRDFIVRTVESYCPNVCMIAQAIDIKTGIGAINEHNPDLVLIDIKLKDGSGFDLVEHFNKPDFKVIFISAYMDYAVKAFKYNAIDYILKPVKEDDLAQAIRKADDMIRYEEKLHAKALGESILEMNKSHRLVLKSMDQVHIVNTADIVLIEADGNYSTFILADGRKIVVSKSTREYEETLIEQGFHRIHKSFIININKMNYYDKADAGTLVMCNGERVPVASRKRDMLMQLFDEIN